MAVPNETSAFGPPLIGALLRIPWERVRERLLDGLHARGFDDLADHHLSVLQWPGPDGLRPSDLAQQARTTKQALNYLLGQLEQTGYLTREPDAHDQRSRRVHLTERGWRAVEAMRATVAEVEREWEAELGTARFAQLRELLGELCAHVGRPP